jgi:hypothetical protein
MYLMASVLVELLCVHAVEYNSVYEHLKVAIVGV